MSYLLLHPEDLKDLLTMEDAVTAIDEAYRGAAEFPIINAPRRRIHSPANVRISVFSGGVHKLGAIGLAEHAETLTHDSNAQYAPVHEHQLWILHDSETSHLLAIMLGTINEKTLDYAGQKTALRTGATSGVGFKYLTRDDVKTVGLFGGSQQAQTQLLALKTVRPGISRVKVYTRTPETRQQFADAFSRKFELEIVPVESPREVVADSDVVICATNTNVPLFNGEWIEPGQHFTSIVGSNAALLKGGWLKKRRREIDNVTVGRADVVVANSREAVIQDEQGDLFEPIEAGIIRLEDIQELGDLAAGEHPGRTADAQVTLHKNNMGVGVADIAIAKFAYDRAKAAGRGREISLDAMVE